MATAGSAQHRVPDSNGSAAAAVSAGAELGPAHSAVSVVQRKVPTKAMLPAKVPNKAKACAKKQAAQVSLLGALTQQGLAFTPVSDNCK